MTTEEAVDKLNQVETVLMQYFVEDVISEQDAVTAIEDIVLKKEVDSDV